MCLFDESLYISKSLFFFFLFLLLLAHERYCNDSLSWETKCLSAFAGVLFAGKSNSPSPEYSQHLGLYTMQMQLKNQWRVCNEFPAFKMTDWATSTVCVWCWQSSAFTSIWGPRVKPFIYGKKENNYTIEENSVGIISGKAILSVLGWNSLFQTASRNSKSGS